MASQYDKSRIVVFVSLEFKVRRLTAINIDQGRLTLDDFFGTLCINGNLITDAPEKINLSVLSAFIPQRWKRCALYLMNTTRIAVLKLIFRANTSQLSLM